MVIYHMDFDLNEITQEDGFIHVYGDASHAHLTNRLGVAWVIATQDRYAPIILQKEIPQEEYSERRASFYGESTAIIEGLELLPPNSKVRIHTDYRWLYEKMNGLNMTPADRPGKIPPKNSDTAKQLDRIDQAKKLHDTVIIDYAHDKKTKEPSGLKRYYMTLAHNAANEAAGAHNFSDVPSPDAPDVAVRRRPSGSTHDSSASMDVIDLGDDTESDNEDHSFDPRYQKLPGSNGPYF